MRPFTWIFIGLSVLFGLFLIALGVAFFSGLLVAPALVWPWRPFFFWPFGLFFGLFWLFLIFGVFRWLFWGWGGGWHSRRYWRYDDAHEILRARYARGEITRDQFEQMMRDLEAHR